MYSGIVVGRLIRWAEWKMGSGVNLGYKPQVNFMRLAPSTGSNWDEMVDRECIETDAAYNQLPQLHQLVLRLEYLSTYKTDELKSVSFGSSVRAYRQYKKDAHEKIEAILIPKNNLNILQHYDINSL